MSCHGGEVMRFENVYTNNRPNKLEGTMTFYDFSFVQHNIIIRLKYLIVKSSNGYCI